MLTNDLSNNNIPASAPPPPPPLPLGGLKNWTLPQDNGNSKKPSNVATSGISSRTEPKKGQSKSPVQQSSLNFAENPLFKKKQEEHNVNSETADEGSNIRQSEPNRGLTPKPVSPRVLSPQQDNGNSNKPSGTNNSTQSEKGLSENPIQLATEQKIDTPILVNTSVGISKATALKYSIATLLLCISSVTAGIYTYLSISVTLSDPVLFTVIAFVSASVMLSLAAYLINSHLSAINSEKKVDPGRKQSQDLQKAKGLEHSNTHTSSPPVALRTSSVPTPPTLKNNTTNKSIPSGGGKQQESGDLMDDLFKKIKSRRKATDEEDDVQQRKYSDLQKAKELEHSNTPTSSLPVMSGTPIVPPPPPPPPSSTTVKPNDLSTAVIRKSSTSDANQKDVQQKQSDTPVDDRSNLLAQIGKGITLKQAPDKYRKDLSKDSLKIPQKQEEESTPEKQENGVQTLNQNQSQNSDSQAAKKLEHSKSEDMQQMDSLEIAIQKQRVKSGVQDEQLDSLDEQYDSLFTPEEEPFKMVYQGQKNCVQPSNIGSILYNSTFSLPESPINNLSSNSANVPDDEDWDTEPHSILDVYTDKTRKQERVKDRDNYPYSASSPTKPDEVQDSPSPSVSECIGKFGRTTHKGQPQSCI